MADCTQAGVLERAHDEYERTEASDVLQAGVTNINGVDHYTDAKGRLVPADQVKDTDRLIDQTVRKIIGFAEPLSEQVARFRQHSFDDVDALISLLAEKYGAKVGGSKGNTSLTTYDGTLMVKVQVADNITFGPELQAAKALVDECLKDWSEGASANLRVIVDRAFQVDQEGRINRGELLGLRRLEFKDDRWTQAMQAISDSIRIVGTKRYIRAYRRANANAGWQAVVIDVAAS